MKILKNRFLLTVLTLVFLVVPMMILSVSAAETEIAFYEVEDFTVSKVVLAIFDMAGVEFTQPNLQKACLNCKGEPGYLSEDKSIFLVDGGTFENALSVFEDESISNWKPENYYLDEYGGKYYSVPIDTGGLTADTEITFTAVYHRAIPDDKTADTDLATVVSPEMISSVLDEILDLLPVVVVVIVGFVGLRKGISFLEGILHSA